MSDILTPQAVEKLTGYKRPADQLRELHRLGFWRARRAKVTGDIVLEWPHYDEISRGIIAAGSPSARPQVRPPRCHSHKHA